MVAKNNKLEAVTLPPSQLIATSKESIQVSATELDASVIADFRAFLEKNRDELKTGMGAFHHDGHSNW